MNCESAKPKSALEEKKDLQNNGFILICDVSEFVKIASTHRLFFGPKIGAEKTRLWLDRIFDRILNRIEQHQGQTIQFIGDAVIAYFPRLAAKSVLQCAQEIRQACGLIQAGQLARQFTQVKSGIAWGPIATYQPAQFDDFPLSIANGQAVEQALRALQLAGPHDIVCDAATFEIMQQLGDLPGTRQLGNGFYQVLPQLANQQEALAQTDLPEVPATPELNEIKLLTILYIEFYATTPEEMQPDWLDTCFTQLKALGGQYNATLIGACQTLKGLRVQLAVGHLKSEINDVELAVQLATQVQSVSTRAVIGYGHAWQGRYGGKNLKLFNAHGGEVNLAARILEKSEPGHIYLTEQARQQLNDALPLIELAEMPIKGEADPVRLFRIPKPYEANHHRELQTNALHGRSQELEQALGLLTHARAARVSCCIEITGEAGIGKSTFVRHVQATLAQQGLTTIELRANPYSRLLPYAIAFPLIVELSRLYKASTPESWLLDTFQAEPAQLEWLGLIGLITPLKLTLSELAQQARPDVRTRAIAHIFSTVLEQATKDFKLVFVIEDLQWYDSASVQLLLEELLNRKTCQNIYTIRTSADDSKTTDILARLKQLETARHPLPLMKFQAGETETFLAKWFEVSTVPSPLVEALHRLSEGNLLLLSALIQRLLQESIVRRFSNARLEIDFRRLEQFSAIPVNLEHALQARTDQLATQHRQVLAHCSIFKAAFTAQELQDAFSYPDTLELGQALQVLEERKLIRPSMSVLGQPQFRFEHQVIEQCVYDRIPFEERRKLHEKFAAWLEGQMRGAEEGVRNRLTVRLAAQYDWAGQLEKAFLLSQRAADYAFEVGALDDALQRLNKLIEWHQSGLLPGSSDLELAHWLEKKAQVYFAQGQLFDARSEYKKALSHTGHYRPMPAKVSALRIKAHLGLFYIQGLAPSWLTRPKRPATAESLLALRIYTCLSELEFFTGGGELGYLYLIHAVEILNKYTANTGDLAKAYAGCAILAQIYGNPRWTSYFIEQTHLSLNDITDEKEKLRAAAHINHRLGYMAYSSAQFELAMQLSKQSVEAARSSQEFQTEILAFSSAIMIKIAQGQFEEVLSTYQTYEELAKKYASNYFNIFHQYGLLNQRIYALAMLGRIPEAREALNFLEKIAAELNFNPVAMMAVRRCKLMLLYREQDWPAARRLALQTCKTLRVDGEEKAYLNTCISLPIEVILEAEQHGFTLNSEEETAIKQALKKLDNAQRRFQISTPIYLILKTRVLMRKSKCTLCAKRNLIKASQMAAANGQVVEQRMADRLLSLLKD
ncbi:MAG: AAA family ATPase [Limnobacter sp.]|uniref:AAA family ATPase n=1 Tax=Limnobacter sp. TaxID=2003368 RepID=UPI0022BFF3D7|nr:AAA family ATPase [Limnobacter sp.]MCZ8016189.1 AAA family ATPase [Limnobacter sp.]